MSADRDQDRRTGLPPNLAARSTALRGPLTRFFQRNLPGASDIDDLVQEVFLRLVRRGDTDELERFDGYVFGTAASVLKDRQRRRRVRASDRHVPFNPDLHGEVEFDPERAVISQQALAQITRKIMALPEKTRTIFILRRIEGLTHPQIARQLGLSLSTVEKHIQRAAQKIFSSGEYRS